MILLACHGFFPEGYRPFTEEMERGRRVDFEKLENIRGSSLFIAWEGAENFL